MKTSRKRILVLTALLSVIIALLGTSSILYANTSLNDLATQNDFHLATSPIVMIDINSGPPVDGSVTGNLFTFTHKVIDPKPAPDSDPNNSWGVSDSGAVVNWDVSNTATTDEPGKISGSFTINRMWYETVDVEDEIFVSFRAVSICVPPIDDETAFDLPNYNFRGYFRITGGTGMYEGIRGRGTIAGTLQDHMYGEANQAVEFVMMGKAFAR